MLDVNIHTMNAELHKLAQRWTDKLRAEQRTDMAVQLQPFMEAIGPTLDISFLNTLDCFHPSAKAHQLLGIGLWNSMLCSTANGGRKNRCGEHFSDALTPTCPTKDSVFFVGDDVVPGPPP
jgi:hypothetical protein